MLTAIITPDGCGSLELISILKKKKINVISKPNNHLYPNDLLKNFGKNVRVIFITRKIQDILVSLKNKELVEGINWIKLHYKNLKSDFKKYNNLFIEDTFNFEKLYDSYIDTDIFPVLFIKYENLYCKDNIDTVNMINYFLNTNLVSDDFIVKKDNVWTEKKEFKISEEQIIQTNKTFLSLENKVKNYKTLYKFQPLELINKIKLLKFNKHYRFGDVVFHNGYRWKESTKYILENDELKDSILRRYIEKCPDKNLSEKKPKNYLELLSNEIDIKIKENNYILPKDNELVIHLRLGDFAREKNKFLKKNYKLIIENYIKKYNITKVIFCTAFHYGNETEKNKYIYNDTVNQMNISKLTEMLNNLIKIPNIYFDITSSKNPDDDLIFMAKAKFFVGDARGFSRLVAEIQNYQKNDI